MEAVCDHWQPQERIALEAVLLTPNNSLDLHVRVWSTHPETAEGLGDPDWKAGAQKDQQGIPAYLVSLSRLRKKSAFGENDHEMGSKGKMRSC